MAAALPDFFAAKAGPALLEVETEMAVNRQVFQAFRAMLAALRTQLRNVMAPEQIALQTAPRHWPRWVARKVSPHVARPPKTGCAASISFSPGMPRPAARQRRPFADAWLVDLGYGAEPFTTLEMAQRLRALNPRLPVLGVEIDPDRVAAALPHADDLTHFRRGGFNLPLARHPDGRPEMARVIRAFNVLRQYDEAAVAGAYAELAHGVLPGGLLVEGTSDPLGRIWVANVLRRAAAPVWEAEALVFSTNFRSGFEPAMFQAVLPKNSSTA